MGDNSTRGHFGLMTSQGLHVSRQCLKVQYIQWKYTVFMVDRVPIKRREKYCVAGSRDNVSGANTSCSPGISMHRNSFRVFPPHVGNRKLYSLVFRLISGTPVSSSISASYQRRVQPATTQFCS